MSVITAVKNLADAYVVSATENAALKQQLAEALANDAADQATIEAAQQAALDAQAKLPELQALADADALEDAEIQSIVDATLPAKPTP